MDKVKIIVVFHVTTSSDSTNNINLLTIWILQLNMMKINPKYIFWQDIAP